MEKAGGDPAFFVFREDARSDTGGRGMQSRRQYGADGEGAAATCRAGLSWAGSFRASTGFGNMSMDWFGFELAVEL